MKRNGRVELSFKDLLDSLLHQEEILWKQKSRNLWLREGDCNIKFFHISASNRLRKNHAPEIHQDCGNQGASFN